MRLALAIALAAVACAGKPAERAKDAGAGTKLELSSPEKFTASVGKRVQEKTPRAVSVAGPLTLHIAVPGGEDTKMNLDRVWRVCNGDASRCDEAVDGVIAMALAVDDPRAPTAETVFAAVRHAKYVEWLGKDAPLVTQPLVGDLHLVYMYKVPKGFVVMMKPDLATLKMTQAELDQRARANVAARLGSVEALLEPAAGAKVGAIVRGDALDASLLLQTDAWERLAPQHPGMLVVGVPENDALVYAWVENEATMELLRKAVRDAAEQAENPLSTMLFRWTGTGWEVAP